MALEGDYRPTIPTHYLCRLPVLKIKKDK